MNKRMIKKISKKELLRTELRDALYFELEWSGIYFDYNLQVKEIIKTCLKMETDFKIIKNNNKLSQIINELINNFYYKLKHDSSCKNIYDFIYNKDFKNKLYKIIKSYI